MSRLSEPQEEFGYFLIGEYAIKHDLTYLQAVKILLDVKEFKSIWNWVNCDTFLNESYHKGEGSGD